MATSIKGLIGALLCVAMLNVAPAQSEEPVTKDLPVTGGQLAGIEPSAQQPASIFESNEPLPLKVGSTAPQSAIEQSAARVEFIPATKTAQVYIGEAPLLVVSNASISLDRASRISAAINKISWDRTPASAIRVSSNGKDYRVIVGKTEIVTIDRTTRASQSEKLSAKDSALLVANRLRRFFGNAPILSEVDGPAVATQSNSAAVSVLQGVASWYSEPSGQTASGMIMHRNSMIAAHKHLPFGTVLRVTNIANGKQVNVKVMDRGPFIRGRVLDLSERAASLLGMMGTGIARVKIEIIH